MSSEMCVFDNWHFRQHFTFIEERGKNIYVQCNSCKPKIHHLSSSKKSSSNLLKHLKRKHADKFGHLTGKRGKKAEMQPSLNITKQENSEASNVNSLVLNFILEEVQPFTLLEKPSFRKLVEGLSGKPWAMGRMTLMADIENTFFAMKARLVAALNTIQSVCTTVDIWTANKRSYFGMTCHWIDENELVRKSAALDCVRLRGKHTYDLITTKIQEIHSSYNIESKVGTIVTDNMSYLEKAFKEFPIDGHDENDDDNMGVFEDVGAILEGRSEEDILMFLPSFQRCVCHLMNLIVTEDLVLAVSQSPSCQIYDGTMAKCSALWNKTNQCQLDPETMQDMWNMSLMVPSEFRWSSEYNAMQKIVSLTARQLSEVYAQLNISEPNAEELAYLKEYVEVFKPLAFALDLLQEEQKSFFGLVIPTLLTLKTKLSGKKSVSCFLPDVINAVLDAFDARFQQLFAFPEAKLATATMPQFRLWWLPELERDDMRKLLVAEARKIEVKHEAVEEFAPIESDDFFSYGPGGRSLEEPEAEVLKYLEGSNKSLGCLKDFPRVRKLFLKYNSTLTSSTAVQQLFSHKENLITPQCNRETEEYFQRVVLLQYNLKNGF